MAALVKLAVLVIGFAALTATLQGCGSRGGDDSHTWPMTTTTLTTVTPSAIPQLFSNASYGFNDTDRPTTPSAIAQLLNDAYYGFSTDPDRPMDPSAPMGVTMHMPTDPRSFYGGIFCAEYYNNPHNVTGCFQGLTDCRLSAALFNHRMLLTEGFTLKPPFDRRTAIVFNQTLVESFLSRCFYAWDGATGAKYNVGCGGGAPAGPGGPGAACSFRHSAFHNICPSTNKTCTAKDVESKSGLCQHFGGDVPWPVAHGGHVQCAFPGPALDYHEQEDWQPADTREHLREMLVFRTRNQEGRDPDEGMPKISMWNEVILDVRLLMPLIEEDPALVVPAFVYWKGDPGARADALAMRDEFCAINQLSKKIPVLAMDGKAATRKQEPIYVALPEDNVEEEEEEEAVSTPSRSPVPSDVQVVQKVQVFAAPAPTPSIAPDASSGLLGLVIAGVTAFLAVSMVAMVRSRQHVEEGVGLLCGIEGRESTGSEP